MTDGEKIAQHEVQLSAMQKQLDNFETKISDLSRLMISIEKLANRTGNIEEKVDTLDSRVANIETTPKKRWEQIVSALITGLVGLFIGYLVNGGIK